MGCGGSKESKESLAISKQIADDEKANKNEVKLLLLGAGESGKSTIAKQMKIVYVSGFSDEEKKGYISIVHNNIVSSMQQLIGGAQHLGISIHSNDAAEQIMQLNQNELSDSILQWVPQLKQLWNDEGIKQAMNRSREFQLIDSTQYVFSNLDRLTASNYIPTESDILHCRAKTTGIIEIEFQFKKSKFKLVDVGGQRSERKKWMHCFQDVTAVLFCVALSEFDMTLQEDESTNRMVESLQLFRDICNNKWFSDTNIILFLNKKDLFEEKIKTSPLTMAFPDYNGGHNYAAAIEYIQDKFLSQNENPKRQIYCHVTNATDTQNISVVFNAVTDTVLQKVLQ